jgi:hypothetical protein
VAPGSMWYERQKTLGQVGPVTALTLGAAVVTGAAVLVDEPGTSGVGRGRGGPLATVEQAVASSETTRPTRSARVTGSIVETDGFGPPP